MLPHLPGAAYTFMRITTFLVAAAVLCVPALAEVPYTIKPTLNSPNDQCQVPTRVAVRQPEGAARRGPTCRSQNGSVFIVDDDASIRRVWADLCDARAIQWQHFRRRQRFSPPPYLVSATGMTEQ